MIRRAGGGNIEMEMEGWIGVKREGRELEGAGGR